MYIYIYSQDERTALHWAADHGHVEVVEALIEGGADLNIQNKVREEALAACLHYIYIYIYIIYIAYTNLNLYNNNKGYRCKGST